MIVQYMQEILTYLLIGVVFTIIYDWLLSQLEDTELHFNNFERVLMIFVWPVFFTITIINIIKFIREK